MRKIFTFLFVALLTTNLWATQTVVPAGTSIPEDQVKAAIDAASAGDTIVLETANYVEWQSITVDKKITIMAAEGAKPMIKVAKFEVKAPFEINGVECYSHNSNYMFYTEANIDGVVALKNCTLRDDIHNMYYIVSGYAVNQLVIDNCLIKNFTKDGNAVIYGDGTITSFEMRNSTVMNCTGAYPIRVKNASSIIVNHCTFYNNGERVMLLGDNTAPATCAVSNCVVSNPTEVSNYCIATYAGTVDNCVYYNTSAPRSESSVNTNCINANPQFIDPANGNLNFAFTSPLFLAATDDTNIGDPRWGVKSTTSISVPNTLSADEAVLTGPKITKTVDGIKWGDNDNADADYASWVIDVAKAGNYEVVINVSANSTTTHNFSINLYSTEGLISSSPEASATSSTGARSVGNIAIENAGQYLIRLTNGTQWSSAIVESVEVKYAGGAVINVPATLPNEDAILSGSSTINEQGYISFSNNNIPENFWVVWNVNFTKIGSYTLSAMVKSSNTHQYQMELLDSEDNIIATLSEDKGGECEEIRKIGTYAIPAIGQYKIRISNLVQWSEALFKDVTITYAGGAVIDVPATLPNEEALLTGRKISRTADGIAWGNNGDVTEDYATWNISVAEGGDYLVTMAVKTGEISGHDFFIKIYDGESQQVGETITETTKTPITLAAGTYTVHLGNNEQWSSAVMASVAIKSASGTIVEMPGTLQAGDALLGGDDKVKVDGDGYICFSKDENVPNCWATWQTNWVKTGTYDVILDVNATNGHQLVVEVLDGETVIKTFEHGYSTESGKLSIGKFVLSETKSYTIRLTNKQTWSDARIKSIAFIPFIAIGNDDEDVDFTEYENQFVSVQLNRTFTGGMYNPICVPFAVNEKKLEAIFGVNKAYYLDVSNTYMDGQKLFINLKADGGIYQGVPYFVAPATNVVNPIFHNVQISQVNAQATNVSDVIKLQGNYSKEELPKPTLSLLLGANNTLFFSSDETPYVKSMRAYFELPSEEVKKAVRHISLSDGYNAPTWMPIIGVESESESGKFIRDGRFVIVREGKEYGILGVEE